MNSGALTDKQKLVLEQRTALLVNLAGIVAQQSLSAYDTGISARKYYKLLANVIVDWHWLSYRNPILYKFNGIGNLVWVPHKFGAIGQISPAIEYEEIPLYYGRFANMVDVFDKSRIYQSYGYRGTVAKAGQRFFRFPSFISYQQMTKSRVDPQEQYFWQELVKIYAPLSDSDLDALASCRTKTAGFHSIWIQFVMWKRFIGTSLDALRQQDLATMDGMRRTALDENLEGVRTCVKQLFVKIGYLGGLQERIDRAQHEAGSTELAGVVPCLDEGDPLLEAKIGQLVESAKYLEDLHDICREFFAQLGLDPEQSTVSLETLANRLQHLGVGLHLPSDIVDPQHWYALLLQDRVRRETARRLLFLIETCFKTLETALRIRFDRPTNHYDNFLNAHYPLPMDQFVPGY